MTVKEFIEQLNAAQRAFEDTVSKLAMAASQRHASEDLAPYKPGIARCVATLNVLASARDFDWELAASKSSKGLAPSRLEAGADADLPPTTP